MGKIAILNPDKAVNLKLLLYLFEIILGLKLTLKNEVFTISGDNDITAFYSNMFNCQAGVLPLKYMGSLLPLQIWKLWIGIL